MILVLIPKARFLIILIFRLGDQLSTLELDGKVVMGENRPDAWPLSQSGLQRPVKMLVRQTHQPTSRGQTQRRDQVSGGKSSRRNLWHVTLRKGVDQRECY